MKTTTMKANERHEAEILAWHKRTFGADCDCNMCEPGGYLGGGFVAWRNGEKTEKTLLEERRAQKLFEDFRRSFGLTDAGQIDGYGE